MNLAALPARIAALPLRAAAPLAVAAGALTALGFAPGVSIAPGIIGFALLLLLLPAARRRAHALLLGWLFGWGQFALGFDWIATAFGYQAKMPAWMGVVAVVGLAAFLAIYPALAALAAWAAGRAPAAVVPRALALAAAWVATEALRGLLFSGFAWNPVGAQWLQLPGVAAAAALFGANGLSALTVIAAGGLAALLAGRGARGGGPPSTAASRWALAAAFPAMLLAGGLWGALRPALPAPTGPTVLLVQANVDQDEKLDPANQPAMLRRHLALTAAGFRDHPGAAAAIWPEAATDYLPEDDPDLRAALASVLPRGAHLLFGATSFIRERGRISAATNSLFAIDHTGRIRWRYDKAHLVPGGEYLPLRAIAEPLGLSRLVPGDIDFRPGPGPLTLSLPGLPPLGAIICYEIIFPAAVTQPGARPAWLLTVSNDAWYGRSGPPQHWDHARLRAIEEGLPVVRSTPTGITGVIDARGGVLATLPTDAQGVLAARLPAPLAPTPFARAGLWATFAFALLLAGLAWTAAMAAARKRRT